VARIRQVKPSFFVDEDIMGLGLAARLMFIGMWTLADREGRLEDKPLTIKAQTLPYDSLDPAIVLAELNASGLIHRYVAGGRRYIAIPGFTKHQKPHPKEPASVIPGPEEGAPLNRQQKTIDVTALVEPGKDTAKPGEPGKETAGREKIVSSRADSGSEVLGSSLSLSSLKPDPDPERARSEPRAKVWSAHDWFTAYGRAWSDRYGGVWPGGDQKASGRLADALDALSEPERIAAQVRAAEMLREFFDNADERAVGRRHPWSFFVQEWSGLRVPKLPIKPRSGDAPRAPALPTTVDLRR
jgi:hypothetical protein